MKSTYEILINRQRNKDGTGWRRLTQIVNGEHEKFRLNVSRCARRDLIHFLLFIYRKYPFIWVQNWLWVLMQILLLKVFCWKRNVQKCKWLSFRDNEFISIKNKNTFTANECQGKVLFIFWWFWMFIHMQMLFLNVSYAQMNVILVLMRVY